MPGRIINWNREKLDALSKAYAAHKGGDDLKVDLPGESKPFVVGRFDAFKLMETLTREFVTNPDQSRQENREGEEGQ